MRQLALVVVLLGVVACNEAAAPIPSADELAAIELDGVTVESIVTDDAKATGYLEPVGVDAQVVDAAHVLADPGAYTIWQYENVDAAVAAMDLWKAQTPLSLPVSMMTNTGAASGVDADDSVKGQFNSLGSGGAPVAFIVARKGAHVVKLPGQNETTVGWVNALLVDVPGGDISGE